MDGGQWLDSLSGPKPRLSRIRWISQIRQRSMRMREATFGLRIGVCGNAESGCQLPEAVDLTPSFLSPPPEWIPSQFTTPDAYSTQVVVWRTQSTLRRPASGWVYNWAPRVAGCPWYFGTSPFSSLPNGSCYRHGAQLTDLDPQQRPHVVWLARLPPCPTTRRR